MFSVYYLPLLLLACGGRDYCEKMLLVVKQMPQYVNYLLCPREKLSAICSECMYSNINKVAQGNTKGKSRKYFYQ
jgi:hypothetical protein